MSSIIPRKPQGFTGRALYYADKLFSLLFLSAPPAQATPSSSRPRKLNAPLSKAVELLEDAANQNNPDAMFMLAEMNMYGNFTHPRNYTQAFQRYLQLASFNGNSSAQHMVGFMYGTGIGGAVEQDQAKAMLYYTFAADSGDIRSEMAIAYRHHAGISTPVSCEDAVHYYRKVADKAIHHIQSGPPGGHAPIKEAYRIADAEGGVYGEGASVYSTGIYAKQGGPNSDTYASFDDVIEYLDFLSRKGDLKARFNIAKFMYEGHRTMKRDLKAAKQQFMDIARLYWTKDGRVRTEASATAEKLATRAAGYLGRMFVRGEGVTQSFKIAQTWLRRGIANGDALSQYYMGLLYLHGLGVERDPVKAADYFAPAADQDLSAAQVRLGILFLDQGDRESAHRYFDLAARNRHTEAYYYLAGMTYEGVGRDRSCGQAASLYKSAVEKAETIVAPIHEANAAWDDGDTETALIAYMLAAEQGFESAQANVAYILDLAQPRPYSLPMLLPTLFSTSVSVAKTARSILNDASLALMYWARSAAQDNADSLVKLGDYYAYGHGLPSPDLEKAASCYMHAADGVPGVTPQSAQAMWNLGWMHENGIGMEQDFHLAKRFYDMSLETNTEAELPVKLALGKLRIRSWWNRVTNGEVKSIEDEPAQKRTYSSLSEWLSAFLEADAAQLAAELDAEQQELEDWDQSEMPGASDDFLEDIDDGLLEMLIIAGLAATLAFLVYYRNQRAAENRQRIEQERNGQRQPAEGQQNQGQGDRGMFPQPGDPELFNWAAGGVGH
ncbi:HCP-like protein [Rhizodiscina lignyota]|uniref:HCP-like protein n=1 Tax=Rhizodiscina lignyota TaxID=1504668 RepID=A0A9P4M1E0_9PEZI|nr:HCP-like protein [Rhizodiscina lignyota]